MFSVQPRAAPAPERLLRATFQLVAGLGPTRERALWGAGIRDWTDAPLIPAGLLPAPLHAAVGAAAARIDAAFAAGDLATVAAALPGREMWRLYPAFAAHAVYLDIETDAEKITAIGLYDEAGGPRILLGARAIATFPEALPPDCLLVTFNGAAFDLPVLRRFFPDWPGPAAHLDLRPVFTRLGFWGGLKSIEEALGMPRPDHLRGLDGRAAAWLWRNVQLGADPADLCLRRFAEYNLYDTVNLRALLVHAHDQLAQATGLDFSPVPRFARGDVLYDVSKILLALSAR